VGGLSQQQEMGTIDPQQKLLGLDINVDGPSDN